MGDTCHVPGKDDPAPDYLAEARAIVAGQSRMLATSEHLKAVFALAAAQAANVQQLSEVVTAFMVERQTPSVLVPQGVLEDVRAKQLHLFLERKTAGVEVRVRVPQQAPPRIHG